VVARSPQPNDPVALSTNTVSDSGAVSLGNISSSVPVQLVPVLKDTTGVSQFRMEESTYALSAKDAVAEEQPVMSEIALADKSHKDSTETAIS
jgi:hypothetical protein